MDRKEVEQLYRTYGPSVYRRALSILGNKDDAREVMQEVFVTALTKGHTFRRDSAAMTWLYSITTNRSISWIRKSKRRSELLDGFEPETWTTEHPHPDTRIMVRKAIESVPDTLAQVAIYYYFDEMTHTEIAKTMGFSRRKVGYLLEDFRNSLPAQGEEE